MASVHRQHEVRGLRLGGHARRRARPLDVHDHHGQLQGDGEADGLGLEVQPRAAGSRDSEVAREGGPQGHVRRGDLVLGLERAHAEVLVAGQLVQDVRGGSDRVGAVEQRELRLLGGSYQSPGQGGIARDVGVRTGLERGGLHHVSGLGGLGGEAVGVSGLERRHVGLCDLGALAELGLHPFDRGLLGAVEQPGEQAEREEVLGAEHVSTTHPGVLDRLFGELLHRDGDHFVSGEAAIGERVDLVAGLVEVALFEGVLVDDERAALAEVGEVRLERGRIHRHQAVGLVSRGQDVELGDLDLEGTDAGKRSGGGANLRRETGKGCEVVPESCGRVGETAPCQLHPVAGVAGEPDHDLVDLGDLFWGFGDGLITHVASLPLDAGKTGACLPGDKASCARAGETRLSSNLRPTVSVNRPPAIPSVHRGDAEA